MRIMIIGNGGSGKSTLGDHLSKELGIPVTHLDQLSLNPDWSYVPESEFTKRLSAILENADWIVEGWAFNSSIEMRLRAADIVIHLDYPLWFCFWNAFMRHIRYSFRQNPYDPPGSRIWAKTRKMIKAIRYVDAVLEPQFRERVRQEPDGKVITYRSRSELKTALPGFIDQWKSSSMRTTAE